MSTDAKLAALPALRSLGDLADLCPVVVIDTREQTPLPITRLPVRAGTLLAGDYSFMGAADAFAVERKTIPDLVACCVGANRERFERELCRLRGYRFKRLLVVGSRAEIEAGAYRSNVKSAAVLHSLAAWEVRYDVPVVFCPDADTAGRQVESWCFWFAREIVRTANLLLRATKTVTTKGCEK